LVTFTIGRKLGDGDKVTRQEVAAADRSTDAAQASSDLASGSQLGACAERSVGTCAERSVGTCAERSVGTCAERSVVPMTFRLHQQVY
jgi:hypothetical protein